MSLVKQLPKEISREIKVISEKIGISEEDFFKNALVHYLEDLKPYLDLKNELVAWDHLSDEALLNFERNLSSFTEHTRFLTKDEITSSRSASADSAPPKEEKVPPTFWRGGAS